ncbi:hypothetical protein COCNU_scaffold000134G000020 [Cocos nucifera]|nr:hypothetical protein [Cocos nucifera]
MACHYRCSWLAIIGPLLQLLEPSRFLSLLTASSHPKIEMENAYCHDCHRPIYASVTTTGSGHCLIGTVLHRIGSVHLHARFFPGACSDIGSMLLGVENPLHGLPIAIVVGLGRVLGDETPA